MKTYKVIIWVLIAFLAGGAAQAEPVTTYQAAYREGLDQIQRGEMQAASESLYQAIALAPQPQALPDEYLPYLNLSISLFKLGQTRAARDALIQSQVFGVAAKTETGTQLLNQYAADIMSAPLDDSKLVLTPVPVKQQAPAKTASPAPAVVKNTDSKPGVTVAKAEAVGQDSIISDDSTVRRCTAAISRADEKLPWFFYYQCGVELMKAGDAQLAINALEMGANTLEDPRRGKRMYGMWFIDYLPYYQMALAYSQLGNWESANAAIESSETYGEFSPGDPDYASFSDLDRLIKSNLKHNDS